METTRGVVHIHSAPSALCPHIEWAIGGVFGVTADLTWSPQSAERGAYLDLALTLAARLTPCAARPCRASAAA